MPPKNAQRHRHREQQEEVLPQRHRLRAAIGRHQPAVDQFAQCQRKRKCCACRKHQKQAGQRDLRPVRTQERRSPERDLGALAALRETGSAMS